MSIIVFAGPNGSGKSTIINKFIEVNNLQSIPFVNADNIAQTFFSHIEDYNERNLAAAKYAESLRHKLLDNNQSFIFETVLSTDRNLKFLQEAKSKGVKILGVYVLTEDPSINIERIKGRVLSGGHSVPEEKIISRYYKCLKLFPEFVDVVDKMLFYDNSTETRLVLLKDKDIKVLKNQIHNKEWYKQNILSHFNGKYKIAFKDSDLMSDLEILDIKILSQLSERTND